MVAVLDRARPHALEVRSRARLSHGDRGDDLARDHFGQIFLLLLLRAIVLDIFGDDVALKRDAGGRARIGQFLRHHGVVAEVEPEPAIFLLHRRAEQPGLAARPPEFAVDDAFLLIAIEVGDQFALEQLAHRVAEHGVVFVEGNAAGGVEHGFLRKADRCWISDRDRRVGASLQRRSSPRDGRRSGSASPAGDPRARMPRR